jgi:hypothetical protein
MSNRNFYRTMKFKYLNFELIRFNVFSQKIALDIARTRSYRCGQRGCVAGVQMGRFPNFSAWWGCVSK